MIEAGVGDPTDSGLDKAMISSWVIGARTDQAYQVRMEDGLRKKLLATTEENASASQRLDATIFAIKRADLEEEIRAAKEKHGSAKKKKDIKVDKAKLIVFDYKISLTLTKGKKPTGAPSSTSTSPGWTRPDVGERSLVSDKVNKSEDLAQKAEATKSQ